MVKIYLAVALRHKSNNIYGTKKRSHLWTYFDDLKNNYVRCKLCSKKLYGNMLRHLNFRHPNAYIQCQRMKRGYSENLRSTNSRSRLGWINSFHRRIDNKRCACTVCSKVLKMPPGNLNNLKRHVRTAHPLLYERAINAYNEAQTKLAESEDFEILEYVVEDVDLNDPILKSDALIKAIKTHETNPNDTDDTDTGTDSDSAVEEISDESTQCEPTKDVKMGSMDEENANILIKKEENINNTTEAHQPYSTEFEVIDNGCYNCKNCNKLIFCNDNEDMLSKHIQEAHAEKLDPETKPTIVVNTGFIEEEILSG